MADPEIVVIAAIAERNRVIGKDGQLPWYIPADLKRFKRLTTGYPVIMGRKTFESIIARNGTPLPDRANLVLTTSQRYPAYPGVRTFASLQSALAESRTADRVFVIGGASVYAMTLPLADRLELTLVAGVYSGDAWFPEYEHLVQERFSLTHQEQHAGYRFVRYVRNG
jgi:dihydrofolate reductase